MSSMQKPADVTAERRSHWWWTVPGCLAMVLLNAAVSYGIVRLNAPVTVAFNMKQTVDAFFDSASQKQLSEAGTVAKLAMRQPFVLFKGLTFQKLCLPGAFRPGDHHNK
ncbi:type-F conjugative transfer system protein TrbI, partial [Escherichia coli]